MTTSRLLRRSLVAALVPAAGLAAFAGTASAHVTIAEGPVVAGSYTVLTFGVPHGCEGSPTVEVRIQIPESLYTVTPTVNPLWEVEKVMEELAEPVEIGHGQMVSERVGEVVYTAITPLAEGFRDKFELSIRVPDDAAGTTMYFPTVQICEEGETGWIELPAEGQSPFELDYPSPFVNVVAGGGGHGDDAADDDAAGDDAADDTVAPDTTGAPAESGGDDDSSNTLGIVALVLGALGLGAGGLALVRTRSSG